MKQSTLLVCGCVAATVSCMSANADLILTGIVDGPVDSTPRAIELYVMNDIADLSTYGIESVTGGSGSSGTPEYLFPAVSATAGTFLYLANDAIGFNAFFGFAATFIDSASMNMNGDDAVVLYQNGSVIDTFGEPNQDGSGQPWEYLDGWAYRNDATGPDGSSFAIGNWSFSGINVLDGLPNNSSAFSPFPIGTYQMPAPGAFGVLGIAGLVVGRRKRRMAQEHNGRRLDRVVATGPHAAHVLHVCSEEADED